LRSLSFGLLIRTVAATALAAVSTLSQKGGRENEQAILEIVVEAFQQFRVSTR
jgi:predicted HTH domain antitoxin